MNNSFLQNHNQDFPNFLETLLVLSARKDPNATPTQNCFLNSTGYAANLQAIDFDKIRQKWYPWYVGVPCHDKVPCTVDALRFERKGTYFIEFKSGDAKTANLVRKIYDSIMMLIENDNLSFPQSRKICTYIVVSGELDSWEQEKKVLSRSLGYKKEPWNELEIKSKYDHWGLINVEDVLIFRFYAMPPDMFEYFVKYEKWI